MPASPFAGDQAHAARQACPCDAGIAMLRKTSHERENPPPQTQAGPLRMISHAYRVTFIRLLHQIHTLFIHSRYHAGEKVKESLKDLVEQRNRPQTSHERETDVLHCAADVSDAEKQVKILHGPATVMQLACQCDNRAAKSDRLAESCQCTRRICANGRSPSRASAKRQLQVKGNPLGEGHS